MRLPAVGLPLLAFAYPSLAPQVLQQAHTLGAGATGLVMTWGALSLCTVPRAGLDKISAGLAAAASLGLTMGWHMDAWHPDTGNPHYYLLMAIFALGATAGQALHVLTRTRRPQWELAALHTRYAPQIRALPGVVGWAVGDRTLELWVATKSARREIRIALEDGAAFADLRGAVKVLIDPLAPPEAPVPPAPPTRNLFSRLKRLLLFPLGRWWQ